MNNVYACGGIAALSSCDRNGSCPSDFICSASNYCCECPFGRTNGFCSQGCANGYTCNTNGYCCPVCSNGETPFGSCYNGLCADGYECQNGNICCLAAQKFKYSRLYFINKSSGN
ncbi:unnamed protein product [Anisakis simplex]|uniref:Laminin EGF-like domain-containing protein n=1 Tax=Anisakis simplex TaxID=6269 RepID=A0A0M3J233_ANISI|nr:unnamed protein product [Anisakis simplex]